jgi:DNA-binding winged helix-turn-helix (wHTH) protein/TolB-like protein/Tfp pilus assembly protein PilF
MSQPASRLYEFGPFRLDPEERLLTRDGEAVPLTPKVFETLLLLVERAGHVVRKDELISHLWPDTFVEESSLTQNVSLLRKALGEGAAGQQFVETVPKLGYRFVAEVSTAEPNVGGEDAARDVAQGDGPPVAAPARPPATRARPYLVAACVLLVCLSLGVYLWRRGGGAGGEVGTVAVLPFKTLGAEADDELLGLGMADALILRLGSLERPRVLPTSSVFKYKGHEGDALAAGGELGVDAVLDGTVQRAGGRVRVTAQLVRLGDGRTLWAGTFERPYDDIFALQDSMAEQLTASLAPHFGEAPARGLPARRLTKSTEAYEAYLLGLNFWNRRTRAGMAKAVEYLSEAVARDPDFALAHALLADCFFLGAMREMETPRREELLGRARASARRALELDETVAEAHAVVAGVKTLEEDYETAAREYGRALELNPNFATGRVRFGHFLYTRGRLDEAVAEMRRARELDPLSPTTNGALSFMLMIARDNVEALKYARRAHELEPDAVENITTLGEIYVANGMFDEALQMFRLLEAHDAPLARQMVTFAHLAAGRREEGRAMLAELLRSPDAARVPYYNLVVLYGMLGEADTALGWMERVNPSTYNLALLKTDPQLDPLRTDPRFDETLRRLEAQAQRDSARAVRRK